MRKFLMISLLAILPQFIIAQITDFDLSTYKLLDIKRHQLNLSTELGSGNSYYEYNSKINDNTTDKSTGFGGDVGLGYRFFRNSAAYQGSQSFTLNIESGYGKETDEDDVITKNFQFYGGTSVYSYNRFYIGGKFFLQTDLSCRYSFRDMSSDDEIDKIESIDNNLSADITLGLGYGRIEQIQDAWLAVYILKDLQEEGKLERVPTHEEILEFSSLISQLKNERFFDARLQKIKEIKEVDRFLQSKELIKSIDVTYFTLVNDNWDYAAKQIRNSGGRFSFLINPYFYSSKYDNERGTRTSQMDITNYEINAKVEYSNEKPINLYWQRSFSFRISGNYLDGSYNNKNGSSEYESEITSPQLISRLGYNIAYYPNTRTNFVLDSYIYFRNYFGEEIYNGIKNNIDHLNIEPRIRLSLNYYISPQLLLGAEYYVYYNYTESNSDYYSVIDANDFIKRNEFNQSINIGLKYQIF